MLCPKTQQHGQLMSHPVSYNTTTRSADVTSCLLQHNNKNTVICHILSTTTQKQHGQLMSHPVTYNKTTTTRSADVTSCLLKHNSNNKNNNTDSWCHMLCPTTQQQQQHSQLISHPVSYNTTTITRSADVTSCLLQHNNNLVNWCHILSTTTQQQ